MSSEPGAIPPANSIPLSVPEIRGNEWQYVKECLDTNWVSSVGTYVDRFEHMVADYVGAQYAVATVNGTAALHIALLVAGVRPDDEVLVSTLTFIAPANAIRYAGAWPVFIDASPDTWQMSVQHVADFLEQQCHWTGHDLINRESGRRVRALLPVHVLGHPVDIDPLLDMARRYNLAVIEDAAESLGARYHDRMVGHLGHIACFSFNGNKLITTGGGGMLVTDNQEWAHQAKYLTTQAKDDPLEYVHGAVGYNYRLTNLQAALGVAQMEQLDAYIASKRHIAATYDHAFENLPGITPMPCAEWATSTYWLYTILIDAASYGMDSRALLQHLRAHGIQTRPLWQPLHLSPAHQYLQHGTYPIAEHLYRDALSLPCSVGLTPQQQQTVINWIQGCE